MQNRTGFCFHTTQNDGINIVWVFKKYVNTNIGINLNISEEEKSSFNFPLISCFFLVCLILLPKSICIQSTFLVSRQYGIDIRPKYCNLRRYNYIFCLLEKEPFIAATKRPKTISSIIVLHLFIFTKIKAIFFCQETNRMYRIVQPFEIIQICVWFYWTNMQHKNTHTHLGSTRICTLDVPMGIKGFVKDKYTRLPFSYLYFIGKYSYISFSMFRVACIMHQFWEKI